jgi:demethylmenaquinone methyltransferase/2-methoxy-6-polyprenyl-1,4-benzoquinol methylase
VFVFKLHEGHKIATTFFTTANASSYDAVVNIATFGRDHFWKKQIIAVMNAELVRPDYHLQGLSVLDPLQSRTNLDLASGTGILSGMIERESEKIGRSRNIVCLDLAYHYLQVAKKKCLKGMLTNGNAELLPYRAESFDSITSSYLSKYVNVEVVVKECWRVLKRRGLVVFHDFTYPPSRRVRDLWNLYFGLLRLVAKGITSWAQVFQDLDCVIKSSNWTHQTVEALRATGFTNIILRFYTLKTSAIIIGQKP